MQRLRWDNNARSRWVRLAGWSVVMAAVWLVLLPSIGRQPDIREYIHRNERQGIDPSAKFYTELPAMPHWYDQVQSAGRRERRLP